MATAMISYLIEDCKRKSSVLKWIEVQKKFAKELAYERRSTIYKRELEEELHKLDYVVNLWELFKKLRKKSTDYDALIDIDRQGYISIQLTFPITQEELDNAMQNRKQYIASNKPYGDLCCRLPEEVYKVCHERINKVFKGLEVRDYGSYEKYSTPLVRWIDFVKC